MLARNAWPPKRSRSSPLLPLYVYDVYTEPLSDDDWAAVGWEGREGILDRRFFLINIRPTVDGRIMFGGVDGRQPFAGCVSPDSTGSTPSSPRSKTASTASSRCCAICGCSSGTAALSP